MRALTFCFAVSLILWSAIVWCVMCTCTLASSSLAVSALDLLSSLAFIGAAATVAGLWFINLCNDDMELRDPAFEDGPVFWTSGVAKSGFRSRDRA